MSACTGARAFTGSSSSWLWTPLAKSPGIRLVGRTAAFNPAIGFDNTNFFGSGQYATFASMAAPAYVTGLYYGFLFDMEQFRAGTTPWYVRFFTLAISDTKNGNDQRTNPFSVFLSCAFVSPTTGGIVINTTYFASNQYMATYYQWVEGVARLRRIPPPTLLCALRRVGTYNNFSATSAWALDPTACAHFAFIITSSAASGSGSNTMELKAVSTSLVPTVPNMPTWGFTSLTVYTAARPLTRSRRSR